MHFLYALMYLAELLDTPPLLRRLGLGFNKPAVRIASYIEARRHLGDPLYNALYERICVICLDHQTSYPKCGHCDWPVLPGQPHTVCEQQQRDFADHGPAPVWHDNNH